MRDRYEELKPLAEEAVHALDRQDYRTARARYEQALDLISRGPGLLAGGATRHKWAVAQADLYRGLGRCAISEGQPTLAKAHLDRALRDYRELYPRYSKEMAICYNDLSIVLERLGDLAAAGACLREALAISRYLSEPDDEVATILNGMAMVRQASGDIAGALAVQREALALPGLTPTRLLQLRLNLAYFHGSGDDHPSAMRILFEALGEIREAEWRLILPAGSEEQAQCLGNIGQYYANQSDYRRASGYLEDSLALRRHRSPQSIATATSMANLADTCRALGDPDRAEVLLDEAIDICRRHASGSYLLGHYLANRAGLVLERGDAETALSLALEGCEVAGRRGTPNRYLVSAQIVAGMIYTTLEQPGPAVEMLTAAQRSCESVAPHTVDLVLIHAMLGQLAREAGDLDGAIAHFRRAMVVAEDHRHRNEDEPSEELIFSSMAAAYVGAAVTLFDRDGPDDRAEALLAADGFRARTLARQLDARSTRPTDPGAAALAARDAAIHRQLAGIYASIQAVDVADAPALDRLRQQGAALEHESEQVRLQLKGPAAARYADLRGARLSSVDDLAAMVDAHTAFVQYEVTPQVVLAWVVRQHGFTAYRLDLSADEVEDLVTRALAPCHEDGRRTPDDAVILELSRRLIAPLWSTYVGVNQLLLSPGGMLSYLPFEVLYGEGGQLCHSHVITYVPSATMLVRYGGPRSQPARPEFNFVGFARSDGEPRSTNGSPVAFGPMPAAPREVQEIQALFPDRSRVFVGSAATRSAVASFAGSARYLHFATHASIQDDEPRYSGLLLSGPATDDRTGPFLYSFELAQLRLDAELVVFSACATALGRLRPGEGLVGFSRALFAAGARATVLSLWPVTDRLTRVFMVAFYQLLLDGRSPAEALRETKLRMVSRHSGRLADLGVWAAFVLIGTGPHSPSGPPSPPTARGRP